MNNAEAGLWVTLVLAANFATGFAAVIVGRWLR